MWKQFASVLAQSTDSRVRKLCNNYLAEKERVANTLSVCFVHGAQFFSPASQVSDLANEFPKVIFGVVVMEFPTNPAKLGTLKADLITNQNCTAKVVAKIVERLKAIGKAHNLDMNAFVPPPQLPIVALPKKRTSPAKPKQSRKSLHQDAISKFARGMF